VNRIFLFFIFLLMAKSLCFQQHVDKEGNRMEMCRCLVALKCWCRILCLVCMCYRWTQDDGVARELPREMHLTEISLSNCKRICYRENK